MQLLDMLALAGLSILTEEYTLKISDRYLKDWLFYSTICKMALNAGLQNTERPIKCELGHVTSPNLLGDVMSPISRH